MTATTNILLRYNYPKVPGDQPWSMIDVTGPTSYVQLVSGPPPTGGQRITAADFGLQALDWVCAMAADNGQSVLVVPESISRGGDFGAVLLAWAPFFNAAYQSPSGADLSARTVRLLAIGR